MFSTIAGISIVIGLSDAGSRTICNRYVHLAAQCAEFDVELAKKSSPPVKRDISSFGQLKEDFRAGNSSIA